MIRRLSKGPGIPADALIAKTAAKQSANAELGFRGEQRCHGFICSGEKDAPPRDDRKACGRPPAGQSQDAAAPALDGEGPARRRDALKRPRPESAPERGKRAKKKPTKSGWFFESWWRRGESNPRPKVLLCMRYMLSRSIECRSPSAGRQAFGPPSALSLTRKPAA